MKRSFELYKTKTVRRLKWRYKIVIAVFIVALFWIIKTPVFTAWGRYLEMAPSDHPCDVAVLGGASVVSKLRMNAALQLWRQGLVKKVVITIHGSKNQHDLFGIENYESLIRSSLAAMGIPDSAYTILPLFIPPPFTKSEAETLATYLANQNIRSIQILTDGFHMRRSYLTYRAVLKPKGIAVYPHPVRIYVDSTNWWRNSNGVRRVLGESIQIIYYWMKGYFDS